MRRGPCRQYPEWIGEIPCLGQRTGELQGFIAGSAESVRVFPPVIAPQRGSTNRAGDQQPEAQIIEERGSRDRYLFLAHSCISFIGLSFRCPLRVSDRDWPPISRRSRPATWSAFLRIDRKSVVQGKRVEG